MNRCTFLLIVIASLIVPLTLTSDAHAAGMDTLMLWEKNPSTWEIVPDGAWGKMRYYSEGIDFTFRFTGYDLEPETDYTLIYYPNPWPGEGLICLGEGTTNRQGKVNIRGELNIGDLPKESDDNYPVGAKIWLVLSSDVDCDSTVHEMVGWHPTEYLFEEFLINYEDTCDILELWQKDGSYHIVEGGAYGLLYYDPTGLTFDFEFKGYKLEDNTDYTLIYYPDPWPGSGLICLGSGTSNGVGNIIFNGSTNTGDLPAVGDDNYPVGAKIMLVLSSDINYTLQKMATWQQTKYLFENNLINFNDTDSP